MCITTQKTASQILQAFFLHILNISKNPHVLVCLFSVLYSEHISKHINITEQTLKKIHQSSYTQEHKHICFGFDIEWVFRLCFSTFFFIFFFFSFRLPDVTTEYSTNIIHKIRYVRYTYILRKYRFFIHTTHISHRKWKQKKKTEKGATKSAYIRIACCWFDFTSSFSTVCSFLWPFDYILMTLYQFIQMLRMNDSDCC